MKITFGLERWTLLANVVPKPMENLRLGLFEIVGVYHNMLPEHNYTFCGVKSGQPSIRVGQPTQRMQLPGGQPGLK